MSDASMKASNPAAYLVHLLTASGIVPAGLAMFEISSLDCDPQWVFGCLLAATFIDAIDGPLARRFHVKTRAAAIDGRTIDDLLDYLTFAFIPLMLIWRMEWLPIGTEWTVIFAMGASLFGFAHQQAKDESRGMFRGFPSYWNIFAFYAGIIYAQAGPWWVAGWMWGLTLLTVLPVWFIYPNLAPPRVRPWLLTGAFAWAVILVFMFYGYPDVPVWLTVISLIYPACYTVASMIYSTRGRVKAN